MDIQKIAKSVLEGKFKGSINRMAKDLDIPYSTLWNLINDKSKDMPFSSVKKLLNFVGGGFTLEKGIYEFVDKAEPRLIRNILERHNTIESQFVFRKDWLINKKISSLDNLCVMDVFEDINPLSINDLILIDEGDKGQELIDGKIYLVKKGKDLQLKKFKESEDFLLFINNDETLKVDKIDWDDFQVVGRVLWVAKDL